jgi:hypothetical protein
LGLLLNLAFGVVSSKLVVVVWVVILLRSVGGHSPVDRGPVVSIDSKRAGRAGGLLDVDVGVGGQFGVLGFGFFFDGMSIDANRSISDEQVR